MDTLLDFLLNHKLFLYSLLTGPVFGSFTAVFVERVGKGISLMGRSKCACERELKITENIPFIGYLKVRGVTPCCKVKIPLFYLKFELVGLIVAVILDLLGDVFFIAGLAIYILTLLIIYRFSKTR